MENFTQIAENAGSPAGDNFQPTLGRRSLLKWSAGMAAIGLISPSIVRAQARALPIISPPGSLVDLSYKGLQLVVTGSGSAITDPFRGGASVAVIIDGKIRQFDFGRTVLNNQTLVGIDPVKVDEVYFTHLHFDHINDYDYFATSVWLAGRQADIFVYGPPGTAAMSDAAIRGMHKVMFDHISSMHNRTNEPEPIRATLPIVVKEVMPGPVSKAADCEIKAIRVPHTSGDVISLAYRIDTKYGSVVISGDTGPTDDVAQFAKGADIMFHECTMPDPGMTVGGTFNIPSVHNAKERGHTTPRGLGVIAQKAGVKTLVPYHLPPYGSTAAAQEMSSRYYGPYTDSSVWPKFVSAIKENYTGNLVMAEDRMIFTFR